MFNPEQAHNQLVEEIASLKRMLAVLLPESDRVVEIIPRRNQARIDEALSRKDHYTNLRLKREDHYTNLRLKREDHYTNLRLKREDHYTNLRLKREDHYTNLRLKREELRQ